jgi:hypothetical protein
MPLALVLGAGASRSVSYAHEREYPSPLDGDFFDLLKRLDPRERDRAAVQFVLEQMRSLPHDHWHSMEKCFYTLHMRAYLARKLELQAKSYISEEKIVASFARCIQALLRKAHAKKTCIKHKQMFKHLESRDTILSFNYDLVIERALWPIAEEQRQAFGTWVYGLSGSPDDFSLPLILKLHGSSNWRLRKRRDNFVVLTEDWDDFRRAPGYLGHKGKGTVFPIFLPFWDKRIESRPWRPLWRTALARLQQVGTVIVWGYSLPPTDVKAQQLFFLALGARRFRLCVIDPSVITRERWREMFPDAQYWEYNNVDDFLKYPPSWWSKP